MITAVNFVATYLLTYLLSVVPMYCRRRTRKRRRRKRRRRRLRKLLRLRRVLRRRRKPRRRNHLQHRRPGTKNPRRKSATSSPFLTSHRSKSSKRCVASGLF